MNAKPLREPGEWLIDAAALLAEPDPGPTRWLAEGLIMDQALTAAVGRWKSTKTWALLELGISIATGVPAFGSVEIPEPGPVVYVIEEAGQKALWRRLDMLCRGRALDPERLRGRLLLAANARVKLDEREWQERLIEVGRERRPRAFFFDPLARMKHAGRIENDQAEMAPLIESLRVLRDETAAAVLFVHHTGHQGEHMRGSSDLESAWDSRLSFTRDGESGAVTVNSEHREEESGATVNYRLDFNRETRTMRLRPTVDPLAERIIEHLREHGPAGGETIAKALETRRAWVVRELGILEANGTTHRAPSGKRDGMGRLIPAKVWHLSNQAALCPVPEPGQGGTPHPSPDRPACPVPSLSRRDGAPDGARANPDNPPGNTETHPSPNGSSSADARSSVVDACSTPRARATT